MTAPGLLIAAPRSGSGKTTVALGLMRALVRRGLRVHGAKCGPDYIDPAFHMAATGRPSMNLDSWAMPAELMAALVADTGADCDLVLAEALMGLFDGVEGSTGGRSGSSADVAAVTGWPVLLVLDVSGQSQSAGAVAAGFAAFDPRIRIAGVVLNKVGSERHARLATAGIAAAGLCVLGALPRRGVPALPERHLGLVQAEETANLDRRLDALADAVAAHLDLDRIVALAAARPCRAPATPIPFRPPGQQVALARDAAFSFVYPHVLAGWRAAGAEIATFSPLADQAPPDHCDCAWLPGGYPELHAGRIGAASRFLAGLRHFAETRPVHGECGGYMVLGTSLMDAQGTGHPMAGLLGLSTSFAERSLHLGYREAVLDADGPLGPAGARIRGHEFHYAKVVSAGGDPPFADVTDSAGQPIGDRGTRRGRVSGTFFHAMASVT
ncbi:MAG: cobyrinate a,c-diamide synthase [Rhodospirillales bacterium]|nr:cobyrinate a,c-diamide synthase [Rhodospirillales bacterium]